MLERWHNAADMRVGLRVDQAGIAVASTAPNAWTILSVFLIEHHSKRRVKWVQSEARKIVAQLLNARLVTDCVVRERAAAMRLGGIFANFAVHMINPFRLAVVRL